MNEFELIQRYFRLPSHDPAVLLAGGDDAAVVKVEEDQALVVTTDMLLVDRHFPKAHSSSDLAVRALRTNISDLVAMAARPRWFTLSISLPQADEEWLAGFSKGLASECAHWGIDLIGGDTTRGPLTICIQMMGTVPKSEPPGYWQRSAARADHRIFVTGTLGDAAGWIAAQEQGISSEPMDVLYRQFWAPEPPLDFALKARHLVGGACDISDGLLADLGHICEASGLGAEIYSDSIPISDALRQVLPDTALELALGGGDDYQLCLTAEPAKSSELCALAEVVGIKLTEIGVMKSGSGVRCLDSNSRHLKFKTGYSHF
jgi:thiamine-monophosphate kinase